MYIAFFIYLPTGQSAEKLNFFHIEYLGLETDLTL